MGGVEPIRPEAVTLGRGGHGSRIGALEARMSTAEGTLAEIKTDTAEILALAKGAKTIGGFAYKYSPKILLFGAGLLSAAGIGNEKVWKFIGAFFGGS